MLVNIMVMSIGDGGLFRLRNVTIVGFITILYYLNCYMFRS
jgi:hypothetical protein